MENKGTFESAIKQLIEALQFVGIPFYTVPHYNPHKCLDPNTRIIVGCKREVCIAFDIEKNCWIVEQFGSSREYTTYYLIEHVLSCPSTSDNFYIRGNKNTAPYMAKLAAREKVEMMKLLVKQTRIDIICRPNERFDISKDGNKYRLCLDNGYWYVISETSNYSKRIEQNEFNLDTFDRIHRELSVR